ncbi:MAG: cell division protein FtsA [Caulobacteraceae bacterium]|nr:MAG: cell division protein FtsA [Caulobacteraceae bacterium]
MSPKAIAASWLTTRLTMTQSAAGLARRRERLWTALRPALGRTPALAAFADGPLSAVPITEVAALRADYGQWNSLGCSHAEIHAAARDAETGGPGEVRPGVVAGYSTGSSGSRGVFLAGAAERADYIGQILARVLPLGALVRPMRLALMLRANSRLYSDSGSRRRPFLHLPLDLRPDEAAARLAAFSPTVLIAPASRLVWMAGEVAAGRLALPALSRLFYGAEPMGEAERAWVAGALGVRPDPIYQATEGFVAAACPRGALHLNEHSLEIELEPVTGTAGFRPVVTDLRRTSQPIVRVRTDDYLELDPAGCGCGYAGRVIRPVMGRVTDIWRFAARTVTPPQLSEAVEALLPPPAQWLAIATPDHVELRIGHGTRPDDLAARLGERLGLPVPVLVNDTPPDPPIPKRVRSLAFGLADE